MTCHRNLVQLALAVLALILAWPDVADATQAHGHPEGIYTHQLAHIFFLFSMGVLVYLLRARDLVNEQGWRYIQISALFLLLWNLDALAVHFLQEQAGLVQVSSQAGWQIQVSSTDGNSLLPWLFYLLKLDHLLCVPALIFLYLGLRRLITTVHSADYGREHTR